MALIILGLFVLVWIISAVVKASQDSGPKARPGAGGNRQRQQQADSPRIERTSETDIDRFMAEIDRLRRKGDGAAAGRPPEPARSTSARPGESRPANRGEARPRPGGVERRERERERERRPKQAPRPAPPPPLPAESIPVLRPVKPEPSSAPLLPPPPPAKLARTARLATPVQVAPPSAVLQTIQSVLKSKQGPAVALILAEIFGDPPGKRGGARMPHRFSG